MDNEGSKAFKKAKEFKKSITSTNSIKEHKLSVKKYSSADSLIEDLKDFLGTIHFKEGDTIHFGGVVGVTKKVHP